MSLPQAQFGGASSESGAFFDLTTGEITGVSTGVTPYVRDIGGGWFRCGISMVATTTGTLTLIRHYPATATGISYAGDGVSGIYLWGAQFEAGSTASGYIPTTTSAVTRAADYATVTDLSTLRFNVSAGALSVTARAPIYLAQAATLLSYNDNTTGNVIRFRMESGGALKAEVIAGGVTQASLALGTLTAGAQFRAAMSYAANDIRGCLNGGTVQSDASASIPTVNRLMIGRGASGEWWNSTIRRHRYWPRALSNEELQRASA